ncbi:rlmJ [Symbiodinium sp. CCMP2592]|nr:rlmJ [Symbiodinium sp. CCMP2592]
MHDMTLPVWWQTYMPGGQRCELEGSLPVGHDFVDGEFPEGDFFWLAALQAVLPGVDGSTFIVREVNRYPSFFILKSEAISGLQPLQVPTESKVLELYANRSKYFKLWMEHKSKSPNSKKFEAACNAACSRDCSERVAQFTPTRTSASTLRPFACGQGQDTCAAEVAVDVTAYKQVCLERCAVTCQQRLELFAAHGDQIQAAASVPGLKAEDAVTAALAGIPHSVVSRDESQRVVEAYVSATWGEEKSLSDEDNVAFDGVMISTSPQHASIQYCLGVLWGYAVRGLVKRLALDRTLGTVPEALATQKQQLERALAIGDPDPSPTDSSPPGRSTFLQYASDFFSHSDWAALCQPVSGAVHVIEAELQEAMHAMAILASLESQDFDEDFEVVSGSNEDFENDFRIDAVLLDQAEWKGFQHRAIVYGCLLADAEGILDTHVGPLPRSRRSWVKTLVQTNALSDVRPDQSRRVAAGILAPIQRVAKVLRERVLTTKLREARRSLTELLEASAASAAAASIAAAAADQEPNKEEADPELDHS